jgi:Zn-dependent protease with chaperone function
MKDKEIKLSAGFKIQTTKAIISIIFFALTYIILLISAVGLTAACVYGGIMLIAMRPMFLTIALGIGLASLGILVLIFLLKFIFQSNKVDISHLKEIPISQEPGLFQLIEEIVSEVETKLPKKVYVSADVNAAVFYDSGFWSMFFPVKKNLLIGLGLVNTVTKAEFKAILSHEFGHFSQKTMRVGSYVYNVNKVIYDMLYDNASYQTIIQGWAGVSGIFTIFAGIAVKIIQGIQWVLRIMYDVVNKTYMGLSREMEFHADEIAASITGFEHLKNSLLRLNLSDQAYNAVIAFYDEKIPDNIKTNNLYKDHLFAMNFIAKENNLKMVDNLPKVSLEELNKFNKSKLVIKDQWASHPSTEERIIRLEKTNIASKCEANEPANDLFLDIEKTHEEMTKEIFREVKYTDEVKYISNEEFQALYMKEIANNSFSKIYNGYYDNKNPLYFEFSNVGSIEGSFQIDELFSDEMVHLVYTAFALQNDIDTLARIANRTIQIKTFDYDGKKYRRKDIKTLQPKLKSELDEINEQIKENDIKIFKFFERLEQNRGKAGQLEKFYNEFFEYDKEFDAKYGIYTKLSDSLQFLNFTTPVEQITSNFKQLEPLEKKLKSEIAGLLADHKYQAVITKDILNSFELYLSKKWKYFSNEIYFEKNLEILITALNNYALIISKGYFLLKKQLLNYQEGLLEKP